MPEHDALQIINNLNKVLSSNSQPEATRTMLLLLKMQSPAGCWEHSGNQLCTPIQTSQALDALLSIGYDGWLSDSSSPVRMAIKWLCDNQFPQGNWGEDPSDTAEVLRIFLSLRQKISPHELKDLSIDQNIQKGVEYLRSICSDNIIRFKEHRGFGWYGSGFWATAAVVFYLAGDLVLARELIEDIWSFKKDVKDLESSVGECSYFEAPGQVDDTNLRIWNTAHTITGLTRLSEFNPVGYNLSPFVRWLEYQQNLGENINSKISGSWGINAAHIGGDSLSICSHIAIIALCRAKGARATVEIGTKWFDKTIHETDENRLGNTLLCAAGAMYGTVYSVKSLMPFLPLDMLIQIADTLEQQTNTIAKLNGEIDLYRKQYTESVESLTKRLDEVIQSKNELERKINGYVFKIHRENLGVWGLTGLLLGILGIVISFILSS